MTTKTIQIEIPAPPEGWVYDGQRNVRIGELRYYVDSWSEMTYNTIYAYPCAVRKQEPRELVRFWRGDGFAWWACDDLGGVYTFGIGDDFDPIIRDWTIEDAKGLSFDELHPRHAIRSDGKGGWVMQGLVGNDLDDPCNRGLPIPCDRNGNPLRGDRPHLDNGRIEYDMTEPPPVEGWVREEIELLRDKLKREVNDNTVLEIQLSELREENQKLRDMLKRLEWWPTGFCPYCEGMEKFGHEHHCELAQLLGDTNG